MKLIKTADAVGHVICHDLTRIVKGVTKETAFRKGHIVTEEDIPVLLSMGKDNLYINEIDDNSMHEDDAADILAELCAGENVSLSPVKEGKIELFATCDGLLKIDAARLNQINSIGEIIIATRHGNFPVRNGDKLAGTRVIPLVISKERMERAKKIGGGKPLISVKPFSQKRVGVITTGNEVFHGRIEDTFTPVVAQKLKEYGAAIEKHSVLGDDCDKITEAIHEMISGGMDMVLCTGGMSVDPDDKTPLAIKNTGADIISYGSPVLPGAMFMLAYLSGKPVMGLPGCVMYDRRTVFDLILPRALADVKVSAEDLCSLGQGGLCLTCENCVFPDCSFGKA